MGYIDKPKYSLKEAAKIISNETGIKHKVSDIFELAKAGKIDICIYKPEFLYIQTNTPGYEHVRAYCDPLKENILIPKNGGAFSDIRFLFKGVDDSFYPALRCVQIISFTDSKEQSVKYKAFDIDAINNDGEHIKAARVWRHTAPTEGKQYEQLMIWMQAHKLKPYHLEPDEPTPMDSTFVNGTNIYYSLGEGFEGLIFEVNKKELCVISWILKHYLKSLIQPEQIMPQPIKGKPETMQAWIKYMIEERDGLSMNDELPYGYQQKLIKIVRAEYGYDEQGTIVKAEWKKLNLKAAPKKPKKHHFHI